MSIRTLPHSPHGNSFQIHFDSPREALETAANAIARETGVWLFNRFEAGVHPDQTIAELVTGQATRAWNPTAAAAALEDLFARTKR